MNGGREKRNIEAGSLSIRGGLRFAFFALLTALFLSVASCSGSSSTPHQPEALPALQGEKSAALEAEIISPPGRVTVYKGRAVRFKGTVSGGKAPYGTQWIFGGAAGTVSAEDAGEITFVAAGVYEVLFEARDAQGDASKKSVTVQVIEDTKPVCRIDSPSSGASIKEGESVLFKASVTGGNEPCVILWDFGKGMTSSPVKDPGKVTYPVAGSYKATLTVRDENGDTCESAVKVEVAKYIPEVSIVSPEEDTVVFEGKPVRFSGAVAGGNPPFTYHWDFGGTGPSLLKDPGNVAFPKKGVYKVVFTVRDAQGDQGSASTTVKAVDDTKPIAKILTPSSDITVLEGVPVDFQAHVAGGDEPLKTRWDFQEGAPAAPELSPRQIRFTKPGVYLAAFRAVDSTGDVSEDSVKITVIKNTAPRVAILHPTAGAIITEKTKVLFRGSVKEGNEPLTYIWQFGGNAREFRGRDPGEVLFHEAGEYRVRFTVQDADGDTDCANVLVSVVKDSKPVASIDLPLMDREIFESESLKFKGSVKYGNLPIRFRWDFHGGAKDSDKQDAGEVEFKKAGVYPVTFTVKDSDGDTSTVKRTITVQKSTWAYASGGWSNSAGIRTDGTLWAWGLSSYGQLGDGLARSSKYPVQIGQDKEWTKIVVGGGYTLALKSDRTMWAWGANGKGQLGNGTLSHALSPTRIGATGRWKEISAGTSHSLAVREDGTLWAWGRNLEGQLGDGTRTSSTVPVQVGGDSDWKLIAAGESHTLAVKADGSLWAWGSNELGQLGDGSRVNSPIPKQIAPSDRWEAIAAGKAHSIAIRHDGSLWAWGANMYGQLGDGTRVLKLSPVRIGKDTEWKVIAAGEYHNVALKKNSALWTWGWNVFGQLGLGSRKDCFRPVQVCLDSDWQWVDAGNHHTLAVKRNGSLWAWGYNGYSQLGNNSAEDISKPEFIRPGKK